MNKIPVVNVQDTPSSSTTNNVCNSQFRVTSSAYVDPIAAVNEDTLPIIEVFYSVEGEGSFIGEPRVLARVGGCLVGCSGADGGGCDTIHSWSLSTSTLLTIEEAYRKIVEATKGKTKSIAITGGEPMHYPKQITKLAKKLKAEGYRVWLETSGLILDTAVFYHFDYVSFDIKSPSSGVQLTEETIDFFNRLSDLYNPSMYGSCQVKVVITNQADLDWLATTFKPLLTRGIMDIYEEPQPLILTPAAGPFGTSKMAEITKMILDWNDNYRIRIISQQHVFLGLR